MDFSNDHLHFHCREQCDFILPKTTLVQAFLSPDLFHRTPNKTSDPSESNQDEKQRVWKKLGSDDGDEALLTCFEVL
ncbi:hypothetical protein chiPu_0001411 [Chiloscyllium punctatum]|uniref:Uncharacterized protein n=1 Tax=Chiloscyllium punctatum TaxID=137246 RepID=A0A401RY24_CHIPU|nr:hypothetical protein [Chiloscyllium punctatum]